MSLKAWRRLALVLLVGFVIVSAHSVGAVVGALQLSDKKGTVKIAQSDLPATPIADPGFVPVSDMSTTIKTKKDALLLIRFSAKAQCAEGNAGGCEGRVQIRIDPAAVAGNGDSFIAEPDTATTAFLANNGLAGFHALSIERAVDNLAADTYTITVEAEVVVSDDVLHLHDRQLMVQSFK